MLYCWTADLSLQNLKTSKFRNNNPKIRIPPTGLLWNFLCFENLVCTTDGALDHTQPKSTSVFAEASVSKPIRSAYGKLAEEFKDEPVVQNPSVPFIGDWNHATGQATSSEVWNRSKSKKHDLTKGIWVLVLTNFYLCEKPYSSF